MDILEDLQKRGLIQQMTNEEGLKKHLAKKQVKLYCGFDPTGDSLHIGHLLPVTILKRFQEANHKPIALIGGGTGMIGDPSGRSSERSLNTAETVKGYADALTNQLSRLLKFDDSSNSVLARNNHDWLSKMTIIDFLRDAGKHFTVNYMLAKDSVASRIADGISYTEFSYMLLQSVDFLNLYKEEGVSLQIGGSDQWGNITAGLEFIRRSLDDEDIEAYGLTVPLITKADGSKFGKTAGGAIWLDPEKTSPYEFYQFWYNTDDRDVIKFLHYFTFLSYEELEEITKQTASDPGARLAQKRLAEEVTVFVHGREALNRAVKISEALFSGDIKQLSIDEIKEGFKDVPTFETDDKELGLIDLLIEAGISPSKRQAREDIKNGAIYINGERNQEINHVINESDRLEDKFTVIRRGRRKYSLIRYK
ncbi:MAG TPA: tyrosine--tRNA ligase [Pseudogracilibacillus sp.]|nr:tyrosine--tRNA ligase [Pseudogracilibacillus sp.]